MTRSTSFYWLTYFYEANELFFTLTHFENFMIYYYSK
jgi:hypothetical protein